MVLGIPISNGEPEVKSVLNDMLKLIVSKRSDYSDQKDFLSNFQKTANITGLGVDASFKVLLATKIVRVMELTAPGRDAPKNESIDDSLIDLANYSVLWLAWRRRNALVPISEVELSDDTNSRED